MNGHADNRDGDGNLRSPLLSQSGNLLSDVDRWTTLCTVITCGIERISLQHTGLTLPQMRLLFACDMLHDESVSFIAGSLSMKISTASLHVQQLRQKGLIDICSSDKDRRTSLVAVTHWGSETISQLEERLSAYSQLFQELFPTGTYRALHETILCTDDPKNSVQRGSNPDSEIIFVLRLLECCDSWLTVFAEAAAAVSLPSSALRVLIATATSGLPQESATITCGLVLKRRRVSSEARRLERLGLINRSKGTCDRRATCLEATAQGRDCAIDTVSWILARSKPLLEYQQIPETLLIGASQL